MRRLGEDGFTLQELLALAGFLIVLIIPSLFLTHPKNYASKQRNAEREVAVAEIMQAIHGYVAHNGSLPAGISSKMEPIGNGKSEIDLCGALVPSYLHSLPVDPLLGTATDCKGGVYVTGYAIEKTGTGTQVIVAALAGEGKVIYLKD